MSLERVITALTSLGLPRMEAEVYVYLSKKGPQKAIDLSKALKINKQKMFSSLKNLQGKGLVTKEGAKYYASPFEEALDLLIKMKKEQAQVIYESKKELLSTWKTKKNINKQKILLEKSRMLFG